MIYAYIRVSTKQQKIDRQYKEIKAFDIDDKYIRSFMYLFISSASFFILESLNCIIFSL